MKSKIAASGQGIKPVRAKHSKNPQLGSVLRIPIREKTFALGQVLFTGTAFYLGIDPTERTQVGVVCDEELDLRMFSWTNDGELYRGGWRILDVCSLQETEPFPEYRVVINGSLCVESFDKSSVRPFIGGADDDLSTRKIRSPLILQDAVQAYCGVGEWLANYDALLLRQ